MRRWLVLFLALLLPLQSAWTAASAYCTHENTHGSPQQDRTETTRQQGQHLGHHFHAHQDAHGGEAKTPANGQLAADADCASCHAGAVAAIPTRPDRHGHAATSQAADAGAARPFTSALARVPDRPQWLRLV